MQVISDPSLAQQGRVLQTGGRKLNQSVADALNDAFGTNLHKREWGRALERLKREYQLRNDHHGKILDNGAYTDNNGNIIGYIDDYIR